MQRQQIKDFYVAYHDEIIAKRYLSPYSIRQRAHREIYESVLRYINAGDEVLDAGCGEGVLSVLMARKGTKVMAVDLSKPNLERAKQFAEEAGLCSGQVDFRIGDAENLPFADNSFECVVSNHVLEHLPDFERGLRELHRVTRRRAIVGIPTCLNPASWALLGRDNYWRVSWHTPFGVPLGLLRVLLAASLGKEGVNEGYAGRKDYVHVFRFPWVLENLAERIGFRVIESYAQTIPLPYVSVSLTKYGASPLLRRCGLGTVYLLQKIT